MSAKSFVLMCALTLIGCGGDGGSNSSTAGTVTPTSACTADIACSSGTGKYHSCVKNATSAGTCTAYYIDSNGKEYDCKACADCTDAAKAVVAWCGTTTKSAESEALGAADEAMSSAFSSDTQ